MSIFDKLKRDAVPVSKLAGQDVTGRMSATFTFTALPESLAQMQALPEAALAAPFQTAAAGRTAPVRSFCVRRATDSGSCGISSCC